MVPNDTSAGGIVLSGLSKSYGDVDAVRSIDLTIAASETVALLGPNGAGKSTTLDMMVGLTRPDAGRVTVFGLTPSAAVRAGVIGGMLQAGAPLDFMRVREVVASVASYYPRALAVDDVLEMTGLVEVADRWASKLSGGQIQRVRFATAVVGDPDLLVLDEPTAGLDVEGRREFWQAMRAVASQGKTVVFATHYLEEADAFADRIVVVARGQIVADGPATEIRARAGSRTIRATLPNVDSARIARLDGVIAAERHGDAVTLTCSDADRAVRALVGTFPEVRDIEVRRGSLEDAFLELTADDGSTEKFEEVVR